MPTASHYFVMHVNALIFRKVNILAYSMPGTVFTGKFFKSMIKIVLVISADFQVFLPLSVDIDIRKYVFLCKLPSTGNSVLSNLYNMFGRVKFVELAEEYNVTIGCTCTYNRFKTVLRQRLL